MIYNGERTMYNVRLQNYLLLGREYHPLVNTTLNEKFEINERYLFNDNNKHYPTINMITIGTDFLEPNNSETRLKLKSSQHKPLDASLYNHIPFYLKKIAEANTNPPSDKYVLRKNIIINGETYLACYGYLVEDIIYKDDIVEYDNIDSDYTTVSKINTNDGLYLNPNRSDNINLDSENDKYLANFFKLFLFFNQNEINELLNVFDILYPNKIKTIKEIGVCSSIYLKDIKDVVWCTINYFLDSNIDINEAKTKGYLDFYIEVGNSEVIRK